MGKYLLIRDADFSENAVERIIIKKYYYQIPDSQLLSGNANWVKAAFAFANSNQDVLSGNIIDGIRLNVTTAGTVTIFKGTKPLNELTDASDLTQVATATTTKTGVQDIVFSTSISLGTDECIIIGDASDTLSARFHSFSSPNPSIFYTSVGKTSVTEASGDISLDIDFFKFVEDV